MTTVVPDFLRAAVTDVMLVLLLYTLSRPKFSRKRLYIGVTLLLVVVNLAVNTYFYLQNDYTSVARVDLVMLLVIAVALKPLFQETIAQWCFSFVTLLNIYVAVVIISYSACDFFPNPYYANTAIRLILFGVLTYVLRRYFLPLYREVLGRWNVYIFMLVGLFINLAYFMFSANVEQMMTAFMWPLLLLILLEALIYISIFYGMSVMAHESALTEENLKMQSDRDLLQLSATSMAERLRLMDEAVHQQNIVAHNHRHFNSTVLELLEQGLPQDATALLRKQTEAISQRNTRYCENTAINASVSYYATLAQSKGIFTDISLDIPSELTVDSLELAMALSNLIENAIHGCEALSETSKKEIRFICHHRGLLVLEISNPCTASTTLDENGYPTSQREKHDDLQYPCHGIGTKNVLAFVAKYDAEIFYRIENGIFIVRMLV